MLMKITKIIGLLCVVAIIFSGVTGCGSSSESTSSSKGSDSIIVKVNSISGSEITAVVGTLANQKMQPPNGSQQNTSGGAMGAPPTKPSSDGSNGNGGSPPAKPDSNNANGDSSGNGVGAPPAKPDSDGSNGARGKAGTSPAKSSSNDANGKGGTPPTMQGGKQSTFTESKETITFTISDSTAITVEFMQGSQKGALADIKEGSILELTMGANNTATSVIIKNLNAGGGFGGSDKVTNGTAATTIKSEQTVTNKTYSSTNDNENSLRIDGTTVTLDNVTINKLEGKSSNTEDGDFYGQNAGLLVLNGATATIKNSKINTAVANGNGVFSYGKGTTVNISDCIIRTTQNNSGGIQTTGGGTMNAQNLDVITIGNSAAAIRSDRGGGNVTVTGGTYVTNGTGSPVIYSTANIKASGATLTANNSEAVVVEGKNSVELQNCTLTGNMTSSSGGSSTDNIHNIMIYQSMSGDAEVGHSSFTMTDGKIIAKKGDMIYVTNTTCTIGLENVALTPANDIVLRVSGNDSSRGWGTKGSNGGKCTFTATNQKLTGKIIVDDISILDMTMKSGSVLNGSINSDKSKGTIKVTLDGSSKWILTGDSYITGFGGDVKNIEANGYKVYVNGSAIN